jgi:glycosyltransferase involved in cell wall biosynthesis
MQMRLLVLCDSIPPEHLGGAGKVAWEVARGLRAAGHEVALIATTPGAPFDETRDGIAAYHLHSAYPYRFNAWLGLYNPQTMPALRRLYAEIRPDAIYAVNVHTHLSYSSLSLARRLGIPVVFHAQDVMPFAYAKLDHRITASTPCALDPASLRLPPLYNLRQMRARYNPARNLVIRRILTTATARRFACSRALAAALEANGLPPFEVAHNGVDPAALRAAPEAIESLRARLGLAGRRVILFAGRLSAGKGSRPLLAALARVAERVPDAALLCLTAATPAEQGIAGPEYADLRARYIVQGGWLEGESLAAAYHLTDVVVFPSITHDPFGLVNVEAMAAGKPVVATCFGGAPEVVVDGETGYVVNPLRVDDLADRLTRLLGDADLRARMGEAGYARALAHFTFDRLTRQIETALMQAM